MRSKKRSITLTNAVAEGITIQLERGAPNYPSENALWVGLARYQLIHGGDHPLTSEIARFRQQDQDDVDDFLLELTKRRLNLAGQFMRVVAERVAKGIAEPEPSQIVRFQVREILELARKWKAGEDVWTSLKPVRAE